MKTLRCGAWIVGVFLLGLACAKPAKKGNPSEFIAPVGQTIEPACTADNDGQRFTFDGYLGYGSGLDVDSDRTANVSLYPKAPGEGRGVTVKAAVGNDIEVETGKSSAAAGARRTQTDIVPGSFKVHTQDGTATDKDKIELTIKVETTQDFQTKKVTACTFRFVSAKKL